jgi:hypothetical protein
MKTEELLQRQLRKSSTRYLGGRAGARSYACEMSALHGSLCAFRSPIRDGGSRYVYSPIDSSVIMT